VIKAVSKILYFSDSEEGRLSLSKEGENDPSNFCRVSILQLPLNCCASIIFDKLTLLDPVLEWTVVDISSSGTPDPLLLLLLRRLLVVFALLFITAPYGRHAKSGWGGIINNKLGWFAMEIPSPLGLLFYYTQRTVPNEQNIVGILCLVLWVYHYFNRAILFPLSLQSENNMTLAVILSAASFNLLNSYFVGACLFYFCTPTEFYLPRVLIGLALFFGGMYINKEADRSLAKLKASTPKGSGKKYSIPRGGLFEFITSPNYFGEIVEWFGFFIIAWNLASFSFVLWTICNLAPRAYQHHKWYKSTFPDYPKNRRIVIPFIL